MPCVVSCWSSMLVGGEFGMASMPRASTGGSRPLQSYAYVS